MNFKIKIFGESLIKVCVSCIVLMSQGDLAAITLGHWAVGIGVGGFTGTILVVLAFFKMIIPFMKNKYYMSIIVAITTIITDYLIHFLILNENSLGEAILTGLGAGFLWLVFSFIKKLKKQKKN